MAKKERTKEYLEEALKRARKILNPRDYAMIHQAAMSSAGGKVTARNRRQAKEEEGMAKAVFVCDEPSSLESVRGEALVGADGQVFVEKYLEPMGLTRDDIFIVFNAAPEMLKDIDLPVFALGKAAREATGDAADCVFPHPAAIRKKGDRGEIARKIKKAASLLDQNRTIRKNELSSKFEPKTENSAEDQSGAENSILRTVTKSLPSKQMVYGVVLDPYQFDLQGDWIPPNEVENTAHDFMRFSGEMRFEHNAQSTTAKVLESWIHPYPAPEDREKAFRNQPHRVLKTPFGEDKVHSGSWLIGAQLSDELWALYQAGEIDAFSIGGQGMREPAEESDIPDIEIVEVSHV